jgi:hypothetical protein
VQSTEIFVEKYSSFKTQVQSTEIITRKIGFQTVTPKLFYPVYKIFMQNMYFLEFSSYFWAT